MTHRDYCEIARKWLLRSNSQGGHGCAVALTECRSGYTGEMPDAIGFRAVDRDPETVVVEVKCSRADFLADARKPHREQGEGMGRFRYFMCPEGLIQPDELPTRWGLLYVTARGHIRAIAGVVAQSRNCGTFRSASTAWEHGSDIQRELWLLVRVAARVSDPDVLKRQLNERLRNETRLANTVAAQQEEIDILRARLAEASVLDWSAPSGCLRAIPRKT